MEVIKDITFSSIPENLLGDFDLDLFIPENIDGDIVRKHVKLKDGKTTNNTRKNSTNVTHGMNYNKRNIDKKSKEMYSLIKSGSGNTVTSDTDTSESHTSSEDTPRNEYQIVEGTLRQSKWTRVPLVVFVHGGGWRRGGKMAWKHYLYHDVNFMVAILQWLLNVHHNVGESLAQNGVGCALISYPLTEQGFPIVLVEMVLSYIQSCLVTCLGLLPFGILLCLYQTHGTYHSTGAKITIILSVILVTNIITLVVFTLRRIKFKLSLLHVAILWIFTVSTCTVIHLLLQQYQLFLWTSVTLILNQLVILRQRLSRCDIGYSDQAKVVARAVHWAKRLAIKTGQFDREKIFLMGHSAGGHLSSLTVLDEFYLRDVRSAVPNIKVTIIPIDTDLFSSPFSLPFMFDGWHVVVSVHCSLMATC